MDIYNKINNLANKYKIPKQDLIKRLLKYAGHIDIKNEEDKY